MDPFFGNNRWYQQPEPARYPPFRGVPVYEVADRTPEKKSPPKVVKIPVHFVGSERVDRSGSALKIQKVFRGFLVRKCVRKIKDLKIQVDEIGERLLRSEIIELIRRDEKERLRMNESLMSLLFKLDSICGVDFGVRACRKSVIRKVIALQERIDSISAIDVDRNGESVDEIKVPAEAQSLNQSSDMSKPEDHVREGGDKAMDVDDEQSLNRSSDTSKLGNSIEKSVNLEDYARDGDKKIMDVDEESDVIDVGVDSEVKLNENVDLIEDEKKDNKRNGELLERLMEDNEKMMSLMTQLFERNEMQMRMLNAITHRVELLEKAFVCDKLRRKKKNKNKKNAVPTDKCTED